ncbi:MAG: hypothetical protein CML42_06455 [Rhodobacteraceae bacterium]|nr:hypothetical protein [Paracoccaceae bacterium]|tara:strand:+ start:6117 stop:9689 length:3573 start_codon:yes stop_codon:yes gene_type:complete
MSTNEENKNEENMVAIVDMAYDTALQPDADWMNTALPSSQNEPETLEAAIERLDIGEHWDNRDVDETITLGSDDIRGNKFEYGRYVTLTDPGYFIASQWSWFDDENKNIALNITYIKQELLPPTAETDNLWTIGPPMYTFNGYSDEIGEEFIKEYGSRPDKKYDIDDMEPGYHLTVKTDNGEMIYGKIKSIENDDDIVIIFYDGSSSWSVDIKNVKEVKWDPYNNTDTNILSIKGYDNIKNDKYKGQDIPIRYGNVVKIDGDADDFDYIVVDGFIARDEKTMRWTLQTVIVQERLDMLNQNFKYKKVDPMTLKYRTLLAFNSPLYAEKQVSNTNDLGCLLPKKIKGLRYILERGKYADTLLPESTVDIRKTYMGESIDWNTPDFRMLKGDIVKKKGENDLYEIFEIHNENITGYPDVKLLKLTDIKTDGLENTIYNTDLKPFILLDLDFIFVSRQNKWVNYLSEHSNKHRDPENFIANINNYVEYGKTLVCVIQDDGHYRVGRLLKKSNSALPRLYAIYPLFDFGYEIAPDNEFIETPESNQIVAIHDEQDFDYIFPVEIQSKQLIKIHLQEVNAVMAENKRREDYLKHKHVAIFFQKKIVDYFDMIFSKNVYIKSINKKKSLYELLFIETVHRKEYHRELKHLEELIGKVVDVFKNPSQIQYKPIEYPQDLIIDFINLQEDNTLLLNNISEDYDISDKKNKEEIMMEFINSLASPGEEFDYEGWVADFGINKGSMKELRKHHEKKREQHAEWKVDDCHRFNLKRNILSVLCALIIHFLKFVETINITSENVIFSIGKKFMSLVFNLDDCKLNSDKLNNSLCAWFNFAYKHIKENNALADINFNVAESSRSSIRLDENLNTGRLSQIARDIRRRGEFYHNCEDPGSIMAFNEINNTRSVELAEAIMTRLSRVLSPQIRQPGPQGQPQATTIIRDAQNDINFARQQEDREWENRRRPRTPSYDPDASPISRASSMASTVDNQSLSSGRSSEFDSELDNDANTVTVACDECGDNQYFDRDMSDFDIREQLRDDNWDFDSNNHSSYSFTEGWYCGDCGLPGDTRTWECVDCGEEIEGPDDDYPDGWTMDEDGNEICERCQDNYNTCNTCGRMAERDGENGPDGWEEDDEWGWNCEACATNIRIGRERQRAQEEKQDVGDNETKEGGAIHKKKRTRRKTQKKKKKKQSRKSKKR